MAGYDVTSGVGGVSPRHRPWWESDIADSPAPEVGSNLTATSPPPEEPPGPLPDEGIPPSSHEGTSPTVTVEVSDSPGLTGRGTFLFMAVPALLGCLIGFVLQGATSVPPAAGYGLVLGSLVAAFKTSPRLGLFPIWLPPVAMAAVIALAGQLTLIGARPTLAREATMIMANLAATAPAQVAAMAVVAVVLIVRRRSARNRS